MQRFWDVSIPQLDTFRPHQFMVSWRAFETLQIEPHAAWASRYELNEQKSKEMELSGAGSGDGGSGDDDDDALSDSGDDFEGKGGGRSGQQ